MLMKSKAIPAEFLRSALSLDNAFMNTGDALSWLEDKKKAVQFLDICEEIKEKIYLYLSIYVGRLATDLMKW